MSDKPSAAPSKRAELLLRLANGGTPGFSKFMDLYVLARCALSGSDTSWAGRDMIEMKQAVGAELAPVFEKAGKAAASLQSATVRSRFRLRRPAWSEGFMFKEWFPVAKLPPQPMAN